MGCQALLKLRMSLSAVLNGNGLEDVPMCQAESKLEKVSMLVIWLPLAVPWLPWCSLLLSRVYWWWDTSCY